MEFLILMVSRLTTPLYNFYNESISLHYGISLDENGTSQVMSFIGSMMLTGSMFSTVFLLPKMDNWGRKYVSVYLSGLVSMIASVLVIVSKYAISIEFFAISQFLTGILIPFRTGVVKLYIAECSPDNIRGLCTLCFFKIINIKKNI